MPVPTKITDISPNEALNSPPGAESVGSPGSVDNYFRAIQAIFRQDTMMKSWEVRGDVPTFISGTQFSIPGNQTLYYKVPRRFQARITSGSVFGYISVTDFNGTITTVTVVPDAGALDSTLTAVWLGVDQQAIGIGAANVISALGYTPVNKAGDTMGGQLYQPLAPNLPASLTNKQYVDSLIASSITPGVTSFNSRTGAVALTSGDVTGALGYTPYPNTGGIVYGNVTVTGAMTAVYFAPTYALRDGLSGAINIDFNQGQSQRFSMGGSLTVSQVLNIPPGSILRLAFGNTGGFTIAWPGYVIWPMGVAPVIDSGPQKMCLVSIHSYSGAGGAHLATASIY
jgi:hypothetical protein